jgi:hypothetical protein
MDGCFCCDIGRYANFCFSFVESWYVLDGDWYFEQLLLLTLTLMVLLLNPLKKVNQQFLTDGCFCCDIGRYANFCFSLNLPRLVL